MTGYIIMCLLQVCHCESNTSLHPAASHEEVFYENHIRATHIPTSIVFVRFAAVQSDH